MASLTWMTRVTSEIYYTVIVDHLCNSRALVYKCSTITSMAKSCSNFHQYDSIV